MKIGPFRLNLANSKPKTDNEVGTSATGFTPSFFDGEIINLDKIKIEDYIKMTQTDGTASALYNVLTLPVLSTPWEIEPEDDTPEAKSQAEFVKEALSLPPHKGGMSTPFDLVLADMVRAVREGYRAFEKVLTVNPAGKIVYRKLASRDTQTVTVLEDDRGGFNGLKQRAFIGKKFETVTIPKEYAFIYTFGKEKRWLMGESAFRAAYYHYEKKHRLYYLAHQAVQVGALPPRVVEGKPNAKQRELDAAVEAVDKLGVNSTAGLPNGFKLQAYEAGKGRIDPIGLIDHHNAEMARSILAQFIMLGTGGQATTGSWALSQDQSDMFLMALRGLMSSIEEHITSYLLPDLVEYNFANPKYPRFVFSNITDATASLLKEVAMKVVDKRAESMPDDVVQGIFNKLASQLEIDREKKPDSKKDDGLPEGAGAVVDETAKIAQQALNGAQVASLLEIVTQVIAGAIPFDTAEQTIKVAFPFLTEDQVSKILDPARNYTPSGPALSRGKRHFLADNRWKRQLTPAEGKVNFAGIQKKHNDLEAEFLEVTAPIWEKIKADALKRLGALLDAKDYDDVDKFELNFGDEFRKAMMEEMLSAYTYAKVGASDELEVPAPTTPAKTKDVIKQQAQAIVDKQFADLLFEIKNAVNQAVRKNQLSTNLSAADVLTTVGGLISSFYSDKMPFTAGIAIASAINTGRDDVFQSNEGKISSYQYSAILDETTCPICEDLDGQVVDEEEYRTTDWLPPIHGNCRCIWVAISVDETEQPDITGLPDEPGGVNAPALSLLSHGVQLQSVTHNHGAVK